MKSKKKSMTRMTTIVACIVAAVMTVGLSGCQNDGGEPTPGPIRQQATDRYEPVPYLGEVGRSTRESGDQTWNLVHSAFDANSHYYLFLLGHVNKVPIAFREAILYEGITPITVGYEKSNTTTESIGRSTTTAFENTVGKSSEVNYSVSATAGIKLLGFGASITASAGGAQSWNSSNTRSVADTYDETFQKTGGLANSMEMTIGNNNEAIGKYRFALFGTTDVYHVLVTSKDQKTIKESFVALCVREKSFAWGVDYEPDLDGSFAKTAPGDLLQLPPLDISSLPEPISNDITLIPAPEAPWAEPKGGDYTIAGISKSVTLKTNQASLANIYYTTNGSDPTEKSAKYTKPILLPIGPITLKAIAISAGGLKSGIMTETYTIKRGRQAGSITFDFDVSTDNGATASQEQGDWEIDSKEGRTTTWELDVMISASNGNAIASFTYRVKEGGGNSKASILKFTKSETIQLNLDELEITKPFYGYVSGYIYGKNHSLNQISPPENTPFTFLKVRVDGGGDDNKNCRAYGSIKINYMHDPHD